MPPSIVDPTLVVGDDDLTAAEVPPERGVTILHAYGEII